MRTLMAVFLCIVSTPLLANPPQYELEMISAPGDDIRGVALDDQGRVAANRLVIGGALGFFYPMLWDGAAWHALDVPPTPGDSDINLTDVSSAGVVGHGGYRAVDDFAYRWSEPGRAPSTISWGFDNADFHGVNELGETVGHGWNDPSSPEVRSLIIDRASGVRVIDGPFVTEAPVPSWAAINDSGVVTANRLVDGSGSRAILIDSLGEHPLISPLRSPSSFVAGLNNESTAVGWASGGNQFDMSLPLLWRDGVGEVLPLPASFERGGALKINDNDTIVGFGYDEPFAPSRGLIWLDGHVFALDDLVDLPAGLEFRMALDINQRGEILALIQDPDLNRSTITAILRPIPAPGALCVLATGGLLLRRRR